MCPSGSRASGKTLQGFSLTISLYDTGAFKASAMSCAFALILAFRFLIVVIVSLILLRGRCFDTGLYPAFRGCHVWSRPFCSSCNFPFVVASGVSSTKAGKASIGLLCACGLESLCGCVHVEGCRMDGWRPIPVRVVVLMIQSSGYRPDSIAYTETYARSSTNLPGVVEAAYSTKSQLTERALTSERKWRRRS